MKKILLATKNQGKLKEFHAYFETVDVDIDTDDRLSDVEETGLTFVENALLKARQGCIETGLPTLADDSGLVVDALNGAPGVFSARYAGEYKNTKANNEKLLEAMKNVPEEKRSARFCCTLVLLQHAEDPLPLIIQGLWEGRILTSPRGDHGFGYDPVFFVPEKNCASAELDLKEKNTISHRAKALAQLKKHLSSTS